MEKKTLAKYLDCDFCVLVPVYYEHEKIMVCYEIVNLESGTVNIIYKEA